MTYDNQLNDEHQSEKFLSNSFTNEDIKLSEERAEELRRLYSESCLPSGFYFDTDNWLVYQEPNPEPKDPIKICSRLEVIARTRDQANENHGRLLQFNDPDGFVHKWPMGMELLAGDGTSYRQELLSKGLLIAPGNKARQLLTTYIQLSAPSKTIRCVQQTGWNGNQTAFVLPNETIGSCGSEPLILQTTFSPASLKQSSGSLADWQKLSTLCVGNSRLIFALSLAFAPPLLLMLGFESGGVHFRGQSSSGKSTCLAAAVSVWGGPEYVQQWRATANGLEGIAASHNDGLLCLDEIGQMDPNEIGKVAYMLANGVGKKRADKFGNACKSKTWRIVFLSSGEISLSDHMQESKQKVRVGQEIRVLDIPADGKAYGCFEELHGFSNGKQFSEKITELSKTYFGTAGVEFLRYLLIDQDGIKKNAKSQIEALSKQYVPSAASGQVYRAFNRFALAAIAGELATYFGITGWDEGVAIEAAINCFNAWLHSRGGFGPQEEEQVLSHVRHFFEQHGESRFSPWRIEQQDPVGKTLLRAGFRRSLEGDGEEFFMFRETFKKDLCSGFDPEFVARVCLKKGWLLPGPGGTATRSERLPGIQKNTRVYRFTAKVMESED